MLNPATSVFVDFGCETRPTRFIIVKVELFCSANSKRKPITDDRKFLHFNQTEQQTLNLCQTKREKVQGQVDATNILDLSRV